MYMRPFVYGIILIAIIISTLALTLSHEELVKLMYLRDFFDVALPILAFGALIKYLNSENHCKTCACKTRKKS